AGDALGDDELRVAVHLGGIDMGHAEIEAAAQGSDCCGAVASVEVPGALPDHGNRALRRSESATFHPICAGIACTAAEPSGLPHRRNTRPSAPRAPGTP